MPVTALIHDPRYLNHIPGIPHVETPERLEAIGAMLKEPDMAGKFLLPSPRPALFEELALVHHPDYIRRVEATAGKFLVSLDPDTQATEKSYETALLAAGGLPVLVEGLLEGRWSNGFALVRPPGHHAEAGRAMGFCLFNNVAVGAAWALNHKGLHKVLVVDWDLHHGNGTQHSFWNSNEVLYFSTHQYPYYPGTGGFGEVGDGPGKGYTVNVPLSMGHGDKEYIQIFHRLLAPVTRLFRPDLILVSAGFDTYYDDPLGGMLVTPKGFAALTRELMELSGEVCQGRLLFTLEGGYHLEGLKESVHAVLKELTGESVLAPEELRDSGGPNISVLDRALSLQKKYWDL
jgi:acetoin utilization deacetylase AcuC-like enzyme